MFVLFNSLGRQPANLLLHPPMVAPIARSPPATDDTVGTLGVILLVSWQGDGGHVRAQRHLPGQLQQTDVVFDGIRVVVLVKQNVGNSEGLLVWVVLVQTEATHL